jgi:hypothetical protein
LPLAPRMPFQRKMREQRVTPAVRANRAAETSRVITTQRMPRILAFFLLFVLLTLFIGLASAFDAYLNLKYPVVAATEENVLARWILQHNGDNEQARAVLIGLKFGGTLVALHVLWMLFCVPRTRNWAWLAAGALSVFQASILFYMTEGFRVL